MRRPQKATVPISSHPHHFHSVPSRGCSPLENMSEGQNWRELSKKTTTRHRTSEFRTRVFARWLFFSENLDESLENLDFVEKWRSNSKARRRNRKWPDDRALPSLPIGIPSRPKCPSEWHQTRSLPGFFLTISLLWSEGSVVSGQ